MVTQLEANWRMDYVPEAVTGTGVLICIDPHTGREIWQRKQHATVVAPVFGDPCPFLVLWSTKYTPLQKNLWVKSGSGSAARL